MNHIEKSINNWSRIQNSLSAVMAIAQGMKKKVVSSQENNTLDAQGVSLPDVSLSNEDTAHTSNERTSIDTNLSDALSGIASVLHDFPLLDHLEESAIEEGMTIIEHDELFSFDEEQTEEQSDADLVLEVENILAHPVLLQDSFEKDTDSIINVAVVSPVAKGVQDEFIQEADFIEIVTEELQELLPETEQALGKILSSPKVIPSLLQLLHTLKGSVRQVGALRAGQVFHDMETVMEKVSNGADIANEYDHLMLLWDKGQEYVQPLFNGQWEKKNVEVSEVSNSIEEPEVALIAVPKTMRVNTSTIDTIVGHVNESRLMGMSLEEIAHTFKGKLKDLDDHAQRSSRLLRELELQAEIQIQSRSSQFQGGSDFDPLEFDRFTRLQELSRLVAEGLSDILEDRRELSKILVDVETLMARQIRSIQSTQDHLHNTRLTPIETISDRLENVVTTTAHEENKKISFEMIGGRTELDRVLLERIIPPLDHILRNSVVHGIESASQRQLSGKDEQGLIKVMVRQSSDKVVIDVQDDGYGLNTPKIKQKAVEKGLWDASKNMTDAQAAEMICTPGFSTADVVSQRAGRGVGMDVVRSKILEMGGRFKITSYPTEGMLISIQLPTSIATTSALIVEARGECWAFPIDIVEHVVLLNGEELQAARNTGVFHSNQKDIMGWNGQKYTPLHDLTGVFSSLSLQQNGAPVLLLKEYNQLMALEVDRLIQVLEVPLRPSGTIFSHVKGVAGTVILPNSDAVFLLDPFRFAQEETLEDDVDEVVSVMKAPLVMVVDDSLTVRKATVRFLQRHGYETVVAKDGQEALELLAKVDPKLIIMDIEMPKMDGFDCTKNIKENPKTSHIPVAMITSRMAEKHRSHALQLGANEYLGKPFKENELLEVLNKYAPHQKN